MILKSIKLENIVFSHIAKCFSTNSRACQEHYDIVVAGGGMVGTTLACTLGKNKRLAAKKILLLEGSKENNFTLSEKYSNRVSALNPATFKLLNEIDAWKHISNARFGPVKRMQVWDASSDAMIAFGTENPSENVAYIVENDVLLDAASKELKNTENVKVVYQSKIKNYTRDEKNNFVNVSLENGAVYSCNLLLGCDGANSLVRKSMDLHYITQNYNHMGVVATLQLEPDCENTVAWQRHLPNSGFLALLPLKNGFSSLVWSSSASQAKQLLALSEEEFSQAVNEAIWKQYPKSGVVDQATKILDNFARYLNLPSSSQAQLPPKILGCEAGSRAGFPLGVGHATNYVAKNVALVGDAAHRVHPLAGQGVNLGFGDVVTLNRVLGQAVYTGSKIGNLSVLKEYETERQRHNVSIMLAVHGIFHLYSTQWSPLVLLRSLGLQATHALPPLKRLISAQASGL